MSIGRFDVEEAKGAAVQMGKLSAGVLVGIAAGKVATEFATALGTDPDDATKKAILPEKVVPFVPMALGVAAHLYGRSRYPLFAPGVAAGAFAFGLAKLVVALLPDDLPGTKLTKADFVAKYMPLHGLGESYGLPSGMDARSYARRELAGAPMTAERVGGLRGLRGLGEQVDTRAPVAATLM